MGLICHIVTPLDKAISAKMGKLFPAKRVSNLRALYDNVQITQGKEPLKINLDNQKEVNEAVNTLREFWKEENKRRNKTLKYTASNIATAYQAVVKTYTLRERLDRVNMIASMFSAVVDELCANNPGLTRQQIVRGYVDAEGITRFGEAAIFSKVFDQILDNFNDGNYTEEQRKEFWKVYENWPALLTYARVLLRNTEGVKLGNFETFSGEITDQDFSGNILEEIFDPETTTLESWQESNNMRSAFGSIGVQVRGIISRVPALEVNEDGSVSESRDDLGFRRYMNPAVVHARLQQIFKGMTSSEDMMKRLEKEGKWAEFLKDILKNTPEIRTKFYVDFKKAFQTYEITTESKQRKGFKNQVLKVLNQPLNRRKGDTIHRVKKGHIVDEKVSIYDKDGNLNVANLNKVLSLARKRFQDNSNDPFNGGYSQAGFWTEKKSFGENRRDVLSILHAYGIQVTVDEITSVMRNKKDLRRLIDLIGKLTTYAINNSIIEQAKQFPLSYYELLADKHGGLYEYIGKITEIIARNNEGLIAENKVIYIDKKNSKKVSLYSFVNPCYMSDTFDRIQSYVEQNDKTGLKQYLTDNYFCSSYFYDPETKTILNMWLKELWDCCLSSKPLAETSAKEFNFQYFLGAQEQVFENFTSKQHNLALITHFMNDRSVSKKATTALYPVFILGDAGCSKFIRARRYFKEEEMIDAYYNVYRQEIQRMKQAAAMQQKLQEEGYSELASFQKHATSFSCLPFLNEDFVAADGTVGKYAKMIKAEDPIGSVKNAIREYLKEGYDKYKKELEEQGILETKKAKDKEGNEITQYVYFNEAVTPENIDAALKNMYMNIKLATIQQLQFMTIDPAFYKDTKDLQKRYKEIHAPGTLLDIFALDRNGKRYCNREFERVVYFKDIEIDMEVAAPDFMKVIAELYGKDSDIYNQYKKASLTDGQGFRSLSSYRSVLGMAGKWTPEMETAYNIIMDIRSRYKGQSVPESELQRLKEVSAVFMPIKPYMYTHEKYALGSDNVLIPVQHKYSEAVLIPELLPEGSKLREMADWMDENDVDMLVADSAVKVGAFGVTDIQNLKGNNLRGALSSGYVHQLRYSDYRIQTNVPEHINGSNLFGTQLRKFVVAAINKGEHYSIGELRKVNIAGEEKELTGRNLMAFYNSIINANIEGDLASFLAQIKDPEVVSKALMQAVISDSTVALDRLLAVSTQELANGKKETISPLFEGGIEYDTSSHLLSWYKKQVNKQRIAGGLLVQASGLGIGKSAQDSSLKYETKTIKDPDTGEERTIITAAQIEMPFNISFEDANGNIKYLDYDDYCNPDGTLKTDQNDVPLIEAILPGCTNIIAYRTPTEGLCSVLNCKIVRFTRPVEGGIIRVPVQGSVTGGWDFDIDKLAFMRRRYIYDEKTGELIKYDPTKEASKNKRVARDNMLIDIIQAMLEDERTQYQRFKPSGFRDASNAAKVMRELQYGDINQLKTMFGRGAAKGSPYEVSTKGDKRFNALVASFSPGTKITLNTGHSEVTIDVSGRTIEDIWQNEVKKSKKGQPPAFDSILFDETEETSRQLYKQLWAEYFQQNPELESEMLDILKSGRRLTDSFATRSVINQADAITSYMKEKYSELANIGLSITDQLRNIVTSKDWQDPEPNYDPSEPSTFVYYNQQNQIAGKLIGIFANENTNVALCSLFDRFELTKAISFAGKSRKDLLNATNKFVPLDAVHQLIAASVDAVKDPVLNYLNFNTLTASSGALLARLGFTFEDIGILFNQPIIKEICEEAFNKEIPLSTAISNILYKYTDREHPIKEKDLKHIDLSSDYLVKNILNFRVQGKDTFKDQNFLNGQLKVLYTFKNIANTASAFTEFTLATKSTASNSVSSNFGDMFAREMSVRSAMTKINGEFPVFTYEFSEEGETLDSKEPYNPFSYEATAHAANVKAVHTLAEQYFPYNKNFYYKMRDALSLLARSKNISGDIINAAHRDFMAYILSANTNSLFNGNYMDEFPMYEGKIATRDYFTKVFPELIINFLENPILKANPFLGKITYEVIGEEGETQQIKLKIDNSEGMAPEIQQAITEAWAELINDTSEEKDFFHFIGEGLFYYCFHTLGFGSGSFSFMNLAPTELKLKLCPFVEHEKFSYIQYLKGFLTGKVTASDRQIEEFSFQFVLNRPKLISKFSISSKDQTIKKLINSYTGDSKQPLPTITIDTNTISSRAAESLAWGDGMIGNQEAKCWAPFIQYEHNDRIYIYQIEEFKTINKSPTLTYHLVNFLGEDNVSMQYSSNEPQNVDISEEGTTDIDPEAGPERSVQQLTTDQVVAQISSQMAEKGALNEKPEPELEVPEQTKELTEPDSQDPKFRISTEPIKHNKNEYIELKNLADYLGHRFGTYMHIHDTLEEIPENIQEAIKNGENIKAWYDGHVVHVYAPHVSSVHDFYISFIHEVIAHKGMRTFLGKEQYSTLCQKIGNALSEEQKQKIQAYISKSTEEQGDEYIAALAEEMIDDNGNIKEPSTWRKIVSAIRALFNDMFGLVPTDADIRYMLWRTSEKLRKISEERMKKIEKNLHIRADAFESVYHVSKADFDRFDHHNHGKEGEGNMAYGWGTYVTNSTLVSHGYWNRFNPESQLLRYFEYFLKKDIQDIYKQLQGKETLAVYPPAKRGSSGTLQTGKEFLYHALVPKDSPTTPYLHWRQPLSPHIIQLLLSNKKINWALNTYHQSELYQKNTTGTDHQSELYQKNTTGTDFMHWLFTLTGEDVYDIIELFGTKSAEPQEVSELLLECGIIGVRATSKLHRGQEIYGNVVLFDENYIQDVKRVVQRTPTLKARKTESGDVEIAADLYGNHIEQIYSPTGILKQEIKKDKNQTIKTYYDNGDVTKRITINSLYTETETFTNTANYKEEVYEIYNHKDHSVSKRVIRSYKEGYYTEHKTRLNVPIETAREYLGTYDRNITVTKTLYSAHPKGADITISVLDKQSNLKYHMCCYHNANGSLMQVTFVKYNLKTDQKEEYTVIYGNKNNIINKIGESFVDMQTIFGSLRSSYKQLNTMSVQEIYNKFIIKEESTPALDQEFINMNSEDYAKHMAEQYNKEGLNTLDQDGNPTKCC